MLKGTLVFLLLISILHLSAQISTNEVPFGVRHNVGITANATIEIDIEREHLEKKLATVGKFPHFAGYSVETNISFREHAAKVSLTPDTTIWQMHLNVPGSEKIGIVFTDFELPQNAKLFIYDQTKQYYLGALTESNNHESRVQSIQPLPAKSITIEYYAPGATYQNLPPLVIGEIINIVNPVSSINNSQFARGSSDCFVNINCPEGDLWQKQKRGVARILLREGTDWFHCTGTLVNNTLEDGSPYMLTADHCGEKSSEEDLLVWQFRFNYEFTSCQGSANLPPTNNVITGSTLKSKGPLAGGTDFKLLLLNSTPPLSWNLYYNGWSRLEENPTSGVGIHHPSGLPKKISTFTSPLFNTTFPGGLVSGSWRVVWSETESGHSVTEPGSSGSPLFDSNGLIVGTLSGGASACNSLTSPDVYGKFYKHWTANGTLPAETLKPWLDPKNENPMVLYGFDPNRATNLVTTTALPENSGIAKGGGYFAQGEVVSLIAIPNENYVFFNWTDELNQQLSINPEFTFTMPITGQQITANFRIWQENDEDFVLGETLFIFPNPANDLLYIKLNRPFESIYYRFYNITGQLVKEDFGTGARDDHTYKINLAGFQNGLYLLQIIISEKVITHKVFVYR